MSDDISRRRFIEATVAVAAAARAAQAGAKKLPARPLGRTGERPSILALGCGSRLLMYEDRDKGVEAIHSLDPAERPEDPISAGGRFKRLGFSSNTVD